MGKYVESNLQLGETVVKKAKITILFVILHITNIFIIPLIVRIIKFSRLELAFTDRRVIGRVGVFNTKALDSPLNKLQNCSVTQTLGGKLFHYGTITINTAAGTTSVDGVKNPDDFKRGVMAQIEKYEEEKIQRQAAQMAQAMAGAIKK